MATLGTPLTQLTRPLTLIDHHRLKYRWSRETCPSNHVSDSFHPAGTASMPPRHLGGVVGSDLCVHGVRGSSVLIFLSCPIVVKAFS